MPKYKVCYSGYDFVEANSQEEAEIMWKYIWGYAYSRLGNLSVDVVVEADGERRTDEK